MGEAKEDYGPTLEGLAQRLEMLERENAALRVEVTALRGPDGGRAVEPEPYPDALVTGPEPRSDIVDAALVLTRRLVADCPHPTDTAVTVKNISADAPALLAQNSSSSTGVRASGATGVWGSSSTVGQSGVYGQHTDTPGYGVVGDGSGSDGVGVLGRNSSGTGVRGESPSTSEGVAGVRGTGNTGVWGSTSVQGRAGVYGQFTPTHSLSGNPPPSTGYGVVGDGKGITTAGVLGRNPTGVGVRGEGTNGVHGKSTSGGAGVWGESLKGEGGVFQGAKAQLRLVTKNSVGPPIPTLTTGFYDKGSLYMDSEGTLFVCTVSGNPPTWRRFTTTAV